MAQLLHVNVPDFGSAVLVSLNEQRLRGLYCDVSIVVKGQAFRAHRAVLAASSLYFRDLFSGGGGARAEFRLPSSVTPACFRHILSFCYTGRLTVAAGEQLVVMYTAGYLQIQHIVQKGMELMFKAAEPRCDSAHTAEPRPRTPAAAPTALRRIKVEAGDGPPGAAGKGLGVQGDPSFFSRAQGGRSSPGVRGDPSFLLGSSPGVRGDPSFLLGSSPGVRGDPSFLLGSSPGTSGLPASDSPTSNQNGDGEFDGEDYDGDSEDPLGQTYGRPADPCAVADRPDSVPGPPESRPCALLRRDLVALPASLISQIGYRCHPNLYTEGDPGEKLQLVAGTGVFMTRGQLMNCHLCAGIKHKVLLRRLLATFFDRNTLANSCGTGIRSSTSDPSRKPLDSRVLNAVKLYCQNFAPNFKESEMNVIAADMCTNARRVRKRWLPKIKSMLPEGMEVYRGPAGGAPGPGLSLNYEPEFRHLTLFGERRDPVRTAPNETQGEEEDDEDEEEEEEEGASSEGVEGSSGASPLPPPADGGARGGEFGEGLRINGQ